MSNWKPIVGLSFKADEFDNYCHSLRWDAWRPQFITLHNTAAPSLAQRPNGFTSQHIKDFEHYYKNVKNWSAGPHLFIDDKQIWVFTPLTMSGVHSPCFNKIALGVEMLGNYKTESFSDGRGLNVRKNSISALATLSAVLGLDPGSLRLHKEDTCTDHDCPGKNVIKSEVIAEVQDLMRARHGEGHEV